MLVCKVLFLQCAILIFIYVFLVTEEQSSGVWEPFQKVIFFRKSGSFEYTSSFTFLPRFKVSTEWLN
jgi:hypothetical protein